MIAFDLQCAKGHLFEGWFQDRHAFEGQLSESMVTCPVCGDNTISRLPSAFAIKSSGPAPEPGPSPEAVARLGRKIASFVDQNFEDVGCDFAKEALKIHYGAAAPRNIRGVSTTEEEKTLKEEGVHFFKFPTRTDSSGES